MSSAIGYVDRDALGEAGHIGAGMAARVLECLVGEGSILTPPRVGNGTRPIGPLEVSLALARPIEGEIIVVFSAGAAVRLLREMNGSGDWDLTRLGGLETSSLCEAANMLGCAYLTGLGELTELFFEPLPPTLRQGGRPVRPAGRVWVASTLRGEDGFEVVLVLTMEGEGSARLLEALGL